MTPLPSQNERLEQEKTELERRAQTSEAQAENYKLAFEVVLSTNRETNHHALLLTLL